MTPITTRKMSLKEFYDIPDNPIQRNTERHARAASRPGGHLAQLHPTHARVSIAELKTGKKRWLLDGHTRRYLWKEKELEAPDELLCDVYTVSDEDEARDLYLTFDSVQSVESAQDKFYGAMRYHNFSPSSVLLQNSGTTEAMKRLVFPSKYSDLKNVPTHTLIKPWMPTLRIIDSCSGIKNHILFPSWVTTVMLMTLRRDKRVGLSFWEAYALNEGSKNKNEMDGIYAARVMFQYVKDNQKGRGNSLISEYSAQLLYLYECWKNGEKLNASRQRGSGIKPWGIPGKVKLPPLSAWWKEHIGRYDHAQIRKNVPSPEEIKEATPWQDQLPI